MPIYLTILLCYIILANFVGFFLCWKDKRAAKKKLWRTPEKTFFIVALLGGSLGVLLGMQTFHHKTKHWYFVWGIPAILVVELAAAVYFLVLR